MLIFGHRGAPGLAPENTPEAFAAALRSGADGVELDCRMTADGVLVVRHDDELPDGRSVSATDAASMGLPTLSDALDTIGLAWCVLELKSQPGRQGPFVDALAAALDGRVHAKLVVSSFDHALLRAFREAVAGVHTALTVGFLWTERDVLWTVDEALDAGHAQVHPERGCVHGPLGELLVTRAGDAAIELVAWTVNDPAEATAFRDRGMAGVITDVPDVLVLGVDR